MSRCAPARWQDRDMSNLAEPASPRNDARELVPDLVQSNDVTVSNDEPVANVARIYDYLLGGTNNFPSDQRAATELMNTVPNIIKACRLNRNFLANAVRLLASDRGIRQFIDIGTGLPTQGSVHEIAQAVNPDSRVLYVDNDPHVVSHAQALLLNVPSVVAIDRDLRRPQEIIEHPALQALIDLDRPVALMLVAILHFIPDECEPYGIVDTLKAAMPSGSYLVLSHATGDDFPAGVTARVRELYGRANAPAVPRTRQEIECFFDGLEMVPPGLTDVATWPRAGWEWAPEQTIFFAGVGRKP